MATYFLINNHLRQWHGESSPAVERDERMERADWDTDRKQSIKCLPAIRSSPSVSLLNFLSVDLWPGCSQLSTSSKSEAFRLLNPVYRLWPWGKLMIYECFTALLFFLLHPEVNNSQWPTNQGGKLQFAAALQIKLAMHLWSCPLLLQNNIAIAVHKPYTGKYKCGL